MLHSYSILFYKFGSIVKIRAVILIIMWLEFNVFKCNSNNKIMLPTYKKRKQREKNTSNRFIVLHSKGVKIFHISSFKIKYIKTVLKNKEKMIIINFHVING